MEEGIAKTVAQIEELKTDIKSMRESLKPQKAEIKKVEKEIAKLEAKKSAAGVILASFSSGHEIIPPHLCIVVSMAL